MLVVLKCLKLCPWKEEFYLPWVTPEDRASSRHGEAQEATFSSNEEEVSRSLLTPMAVGGAGTGEGALSLAVMQAKNGALSQVLHIQGTQSTCGPRNTQQMHDTIPTLGG